MRLLLFLFTLSFACNSPRLKSPAYNNDSLSVKMQQTLRFYFQHKDYERPLSYLDSIWGSQEGVKNAAFESTWYSYKGAAFVFLNKFDSAKACLDRALYLGETNNLSKQKAVAKIQLAAFYSKQNAFDSALANGLEAIELSRGYDIPELPFLYSQLAFLYRKADDDTNFKKYLFEGLKSSNDSTQIAAFSSEIGRYFFNRGQIDSALYFYNNFEQFNKYAVYYTRCRRQEDIALLFLSMNRKAEAIQFLKEAIGCYKQDGTAHASEYINTGIALVEMKEFKDATPYFDTASLIAKKQLDLENISNVFFWKSAILLSQGRNGEAYRLLDSSYIYHLQHDTIAFRNQAAGVEAITVRKLKDEQIASLNLVNEAMKKVNRQRLFIIIALVLGGLAFAAWVYGYVRRKKMQHLIREYEMELQTLRSQMEPHFLFNLLANLQGYIESGENEKAKEFLYKASLFMRLSIDNARQSFIPLADEITIAEHYLSLQTEQFEHSFEYQIETAGVATDKILVPTMLLQPFVENAIVHGFKNLGKKGSLLIRFTREPNLLRCIIEDNGNGLHYPVNRSAWGTHAIAITQDRLQVLSKKTGTKAKLEIVDKTEINEGSGVRVTIDIPFLINNQYRK